MLSDLEIIKLAIEDNMISPFIGENVKEMNGNKVISYGLSSYGYDIRMGNTYKLIDSLDYYFSSETEAYETLLDPKKDPTTTEGQFGDIAIIAPNSGLLVSSIEYFKMPTDVSAICVGKSTYARCGLIVNVTPLEPGWEGILTIELINTNQDALKIYPNEGIAQLLFFKNSPCQVSYKDKGGKYQGQIGVTGPK